MEFQTEAYDSAEAFLARFNGNRPGCLLVNESLRGMSGAKLHEQLIASKIHLPVILISAYGNMASAIEAIKRGAIDVLEQPLHPQQLCESIREGVKLAVQRHKQQAECERMKAWWAQFTPSERDVLRLIVAGETNKAIAAQLDVSIRTVQFRRASILKKVNVVCRAELITLADAMAR